MKTSSLTLPGHDLQTDGMLINNRVTIIYEHNLETQQDAYLQDVD